MFQAITMGSSTVDAFASTEVEEIIDIKTSTSEEEFIAYPLGSKIVVNEMRYDVGGTGVNVGVGLARLGMKTAYLGKVGNDVNGKLIMERLEKENLAFIGARGLQSGFSIILDSHLEHDRTILAYKGCNNDLKETEVDFSKLETEWLFVASMLGESFETMKGVVAHVKDSGGKIAFNPSSTLAKKGYDFVKPIMDKTDFLSVNEEEAEMLVGAGTAEEKLRRFSMPLVVLTMGEKGLMAMDENNIYEAKPLPNVKVCENTGAGDACTAGILAGLILDKPIEDCLKMGMINAESILCHYGAHNKLFNMQEMEEHLSKDTREISKRSR
ncbi:carbohydrate kinase family protein [Nanoarchaeota archaeon]